MNHDRQEDQMPAAFRAAGDPPVPSRLVAITGGPGSGKTSLIDYLGSLGYATVPEAALQIIDELIRERGVSGQIEWRQAHPAEFVRLIMVRQATLEAACTVAEGQLGFCDRGRPDALAYAELFGLEVDSEIRVHVDGQRYLWVFVLDTLSDFRTRPATGRTSDRARSLRICDLLHEAYGSLGYTPTRVPELSIRDRARFVLSELGEQNLIS
jgi:predicted ATPase